jgi:hypothetical protein
MIRVNKPPNSRKVSRIASALQLVSRGTSAVLWNFAWLDVPRGTSEQFCWEILRERAVFVVRNVPRETFHPRRSIVGIDFLDLPPRKMFHVERRSLSYLANRLDSQAPFSLFEIALPGPLEPFLVARYHSSLFLNLLQVNMRFGCVLRNGSVPRGTHAPTFQPLSVGQSAIKATLAIFAGQML